MRQKRVASENDLQLYSYIVDKAEKVSLEIYNIIDSSTVDVGGIISVFGPQNSGKSIVGCKLASLETSLKGKRVVVVAQPKVDRPDVLVDKLFSRSGISYPAKSFSSKNEIEALFHDASVVIIDEIQFVPSELHGYFLKEVEIFNKRGGWLIVLGLRFSSLQTEFLLSTVLFERSTYVYELKATCQMCGRREAVRNQRLVNGKASSYHDPELIPPSEEVIYEPRCFDCLVV